MLLLARLTKARSLRPTRGYSSKSESRSAHSEWYASMLPGMIPVALLGSGVYMVSTIVTYMPNCGLSHHFVIHAF
jgi:hypothetical protein